MSNYQEKLNQLESQIKKEGGNENVQFRSSSGSDSRDSNRRIGSIRVPERNQEINSIKGGNKVMITVEGALKDLEAIEADTTITDTAKVLRACKVLIKFLSTIRSNQLLTDVDRVRIQKTKAERKPEIK